MKRKVFGRKVGSCKPFDLLIESSGATTGGREVDPDDLKEFEIASTRRVVAVFRELRMEGYVVFEDDETHYQFSPEEDFVYPNDLQMRMPKF